MLLVIDLERKGLLDLQKLKRDHFGYVVEPSQRESNMHQFEGHHFVSRFAPCFANPFPPYSLQKRPKPQNCPKFVPAIVWGGSSQGD